MWVSSGCWQPTEGDSANQFLSVLAYDGEDLTRVGLDVFTDSSGFFGLGAHKAQTDHAVASVAKPLLWVASGNQFFSSIIHPADASARGARTEVLVLPVGFEGGKRGLQAFASWEPVPAADLSRTFAGEFFVGPKEYARVAALPDGQVAVLQFSKLLGFISFGAVCKLLLAVLGGVHWLLEWSGAWSWGWAIVLLTCLIKVITWPLTAIQMKAAKKMQKFAKPMQDIREKHKDNPEKMQKELMKLQAKISKAKHKELLKKEGATAEEFEKAREAIFTPLGEAAQAIYADAAKQAEANAGAPGADAGPAPEGKKKAKDGKVVDGDFEVVDEDKK